MLYLGADHGGFAHKESLKQWLTQRGVAFEDLGAFQESPEDDYPVIAFAVAEAVAKSPEHLGILLCRSGSGVTIAANRVPKVRAVECSDVRAAEYARNANHANVLSLSGDWLSFEQQQAIVQSFLAATPSTEARHLRRIAMLDQHTSPSMQNTPKVQA